MLLCLLKIAVAKLEMCLLVCFSKWCFLSPDPVVASLAQDIFKELAQIEACQGPMQMRLIPTLVSIMQAPADKIPAGLCAVSATVVHGLSWRWFPVL